MASKMNGADLSDWARAPPKGTNWERLLKAIYNHEERSFLGRTAKRWGIVLVFYAVFYAVLALLFAVCMAGLFSTIDTSRPTYTLDASLIGSNPGVAFRPRPDYGDEFNLDLDNATSYETLVQQLEEFAKQNGGPELAGCSVADNFGYPESPCFFIKLNKIYEWLPQYYTASSLPDDMPADLKEHIQSLPTEKQNSIWVSCWQTGANTSSIEYPGRRGLPSMYYPYVKQIEYRSPYVVVKITPNGKKSTFRCRAWAKNIIYNPSMKEPSGYTAFTINLNGNYDKNTTST